MLEREEILNILKEAKVLLNGHFLLTSQKHSSIYLQCAKIFRNYKYSEILCKELAKHFENEKIDVVIGPAMGAVLMAYEVSKHLNCENYFTERVNGEMVLKRNFNIHNGMKVLLVEDVITTGGSIIEVYNLVKSMGADVIGIGSIIDRTGGEITFEVPYKSVISMKVESFDKQDCPICKEGNIELVKPGSRNINK